MANKLLLNTVTVFFFSSIYPGGLFPFWVVLLVFYLSEAFYLQSKCTARCTAYIIKHIFACLLVNAAEFLIQKLTPPRPLKPHMDCPIYNVYIIYIKSLG